MRKYVDIHSHMLPGVDDGAQTMEETLEMLRISYEEGARGVVFTPHYEGGHNAYQPEQLEDIYRKVKDAALEHWKDMDIYLGNELLYEQGVAEHVKDARVHRMNGTKYVLVEFNIRIHYKELYHAVQKLQKMRFRPIIAHVERYRCLVKHPEHIAELCRMGVYLQMNMSSVVGSMFREEVRWCRKLLKEQKISFLGTDAHDAKHRAPHTKEALKWMEKHLEDTYLENILWDYPVKMLDNQYLEV